MPTDLLHLAGRTCTVRFAVSGLCGKPAVRLIGKRGQYAECAEHAGPEPSLGLYTGKTVVVRKYGREYTGKVRAVFPKRVLVTFRLASGSCKTLYFPKEEVY